jgi:hypothetical protein
MEWKIPLDIMSAGELLKKYPTEAEYLEYIYDDYVECVQHCLPRVQKRAARFNWTLYLLAASAIILLVMKFGGA